MMKKILAFGASVLLTLLAYAQVAIVPAPQNIQWGRGTLEVKNGASFYLKTTVKLPETDLALLQSILPIKKTKKAIPIHFVKTDKDFAQAKIKKGAYSLVVAKNKIVIQALDDVGFFYALQSLKQVVQKKNNGVSIPLLSLQDYPDVAFRGVVEGFYGQPWSFEERLSQFDLYGKLKMNTYIFGPKDDPYHSSPHWRKPYPDKEAELLKSLVQAAQKNKVLFTWAIHPGKDIQWNKEDSLNVLHKFELMYDLGVRSFAVFFDDISGEGTKAVKQAALMNYLHKEFVEKRKDVAPLLICPTEYNKSWSNPKPGTYLDILGNELHPSINIMWTGNTVVADIDKKTMDYINPRIKRPAYIWWNFPVNDYRRDHLPMGPACGNALDIKNDLSGFVSNPMEHAEASKIGIWGAGEYAWNMQQYDSSKAYLRAIDFLLPENKAALKIFTDNNSDYGVTGHRYRKNESVEAKPYLEKLWHNIKQAASSVVTTEEYRFALDYFASIEKSAKEILTTASNKALLEEMYPWLQQFELLGKWGANSLHTYALLQEGYLEKSWNTIVSAKDIAAQMKENNQSKNQNPWQPGVKVGTLVLTPFVQSLIQANNNTLLEKITGHAIVATERKANEKNISTAAQLKNQGVNVHDKGFNIVPALEVIQLQPNDFVGLQWLDNKQAEKISFNFDVDNLQSFGVFEYAEDGSTWQKIDFAKNAKKGELSLQNTKAMAIRFRNKTSEVQNIYLKEFAVKAKEATNSFSIDLALDKDLHTFVTILPNQSINTNVPKKKVVLLLDAQGQPFLINNKTYQQNYILLEDTKDVSENINIKNLGKAPIRLYELVWKD